MASGKQEESKLDKLKHFLGFSKSGTGHGPGLRPPSREFIFTAELLKEMGPESPANNRIKMIRDLSKEVQDKELEPNAVETLWLTIADLLQPHVSTESRHIAMKFVICLIKGQYKNLGIMRGHFFRVIVNHSIPEDLAERLELFIVLSDNGKDLTYFEEEAGPFLLKWMPELITCSKVAEFLQLLINAIKFNAAYLDQDVMSGLVRYTCVVANRSKSEEDIDLCLKVLDTIVCYSFLPSDSLYYFIEALCRSVNVEKFCQTSWKLMRNLLGTHLGHSGIYTMCCILQDNRNLHDVSLLRGAVFFVGMALWGSKKVPSLKHTPSSVLPSFLQALQCKHALVAFEVVLSLERLVKKYGKELQLVAWDIILEILDYMLELTQTVIVHETAVASKLHEILSTIESLYEAQQYHGSTSTFFNIIEKCASKRPEHSVLLLILFRAQSIHPAKEDWIKNICVLMEKYFRQETRTKIRLRTLDVLSDIISKNKQLYEDDLVKGVVLPHLSHIESDSDPDVRVLATQLLVNLTLGCSSPRCMEMLAFLEKVVQRPRQKVIPATSSSSSLPKESDALQMREDCCPEDIKTAVFGLVEIFKTKMFLLPSSHSLKAYELLISHLQSHYSHDYDTESATAIRLMIFQCFLYLRADPLYRLGQLDPLIQNKRKYSFYMLCDYRDGSERRNSRVSPASSAAPSPVVVTFNSTVLQYSQAFSMFNSCLEFEKDWRVLRAVLEGLCLLLQNKTLVLAASDHVESMCRKLCSMVSDRNLGLPEKLRETPSKFTKSEFHSYIFPVLACLVTYHSVLDKQRQRDLINCLEFGLVSPKCAKICVSALNLCTMEMQEVMMRVLPSVLLKFSQISATVAMATPMLEFLSNLINIPKLYSNFVEDHYRSIFAIALPYTNPFKFSHYAVSLAYRVIAKWFLKCRLTFRKDMVSFINRGLDAVLRQLKESTKQKMHPEPEEPAFRQRSNTIGAAMRKRKSKEEAKITKESHEAPASINNSKPGLDESLYNFHQELMETCIDVLARYTFASVTSMPKRTSVTEFLLAGGQSQSWLLGHRIITITTSGGGSKLGKSGLCDKCSALCRTGVGSQNDPHDDPFLSTSASEEKVKLEGASSMRRRHKSAYVSPCPREALRQQSVDDIQLHKHGSSPEEGQSAGSQDKSLASESSLGKSLVTEEVQTMDSLVQGLKQKSTATASPHVCSCWCQGWAEVYIRRPSGNISWIMRLENESLMFSSSGQDFPLADIGTLFMYNAEKAFDANSIGRIDSESLGENEYESLYEQHFPNLEERSANIAEVSVSDSVVSQLISEDESMSGVILEVTGVSGTGIEKEENTITGSEKQAHKGEDVTSDISPELSDKENAAASTGFLKRSTVRRTSSSPNLGSIPIQATAEFLNTGQLQAQQTLSPPTDSVKMHSESNIAEILHSKEDHRKVVISSPTRTPEHGIQTLHPAFNTQMSVDSATLSSFSDEVRDLPVIPRKPRGHTLSVMDNLESGKDMGRGVGRDTVKTGINPSFVFLQLYHSAFFGERKEEKPLVLPQSEVIERAMKNLDRIAPQETHKIGVLYVGPGQVGDEGAILRNVYGSSRYVEFLRGLGTLLRLSDCNPDHTYVGGLDLHGNDGNFAYTWHGDQMQVIFHVATLMPNKESDPNCNAKKLHIGNDYVNIVYNESGEEYQTGTIKCQFNYVNIVIQPLDQESNAITVRAKADIAPIIGHQDSKIISDKHLSVYVRQMALHANLASLILMRQKSNPSDPYASNWLERLRQIKRIKSKILQLQNTSNENTKSDSITEDFTNFV